MGGAPQFKTYVPLNFEPAYFRGIPTERSELSEVEVSEMMEGAREESSLRSPAGRSVHSSDSFDFNHTIKSIYEVMSIADNPLYSSSVSSL